MNLHLDITKQVWSQPGNMTGDCIWSPMNKDIKSKIDTKLSNNILWKRLVLPIERKIIINNLRIELK